MLHRAGFTDVRLAPEQEGRLLDYRCGITAVVSRPTRRADEVAAAEFRAARPGFEAKMARYAPKAVAFLGKRALATMLSVPDLDWGRFPPGFAGTTAWVLPNPSGLNRAFGFDALVAAYAQLRHAVADG